MHRAGLASSRRRPVNSALGSTQDKAAAMPKLRTAKTPASEALAPIQNSHALTKRTGASSPPYLHVASRDRPLHCEAWARKTVGVTATRKAVPLATNAGGNTKDWRRSLSLGRYLICVAQSLGSSASSTACASRHRRALPNLPLNRSANGRPPGPGRRYAVHCLRPGPGALPSSPG